MAMVIGYLIYLVYSETKLALPASTFAAGRGKMFLGLLSETRLGLAAVGPLMMAAISLSFLLIGTIVRHLLVRPTIEFLLPRTFKS